MSQVFSKRFLGGYFTPGTYSYLVPAGYTAVLRQITWIQTPFSGRQQVEIIGPGGSGLIATADFTGATQNQGSSIETRVVAVAGESFYAVVTGQAASIWLSGYLLYGLPP